MAPRSFAAEPNFFPSRRRQTRFDCDWSSAVCSSDLNADDRRFPHARQGVQHILNFTRSHFFAPTFDDIVLAADEVKIALLVGAKQIAATADPFSRQDRKSVV